MFELISTRVCLPFKLISDGKIARSSGTLRYQLDVSLLRGGNGKRQADPQQSQLSDKGLRDTLYARVRRIDGRSMNYIGTPLTTSAEDSLALRVDTIDSICEAREREEPLLLFHRFSLSLSLLLVHVFFVEHPEAGRSSINFPGNLGNLRGPERGARR